MTGHIARSVILLAMIACRSVAGGAEPTSGQVPAPRSGADAPDTAPVTAFVGVSILPMTRTDVILHDHTLVVRGDRIAAVGPTRSVRIPAGARHVDGSGKYVIPGLTDMHVHLEHFEEPAVLMLFVANGVTTVRNMDGRDYILEWKRAVDRGDLLGPAIVTAGPVLDGDPPLLPDNTSIRSSAEGRSQVEAQVSAGYDFIKVYTNLSPAAYQGVLDAAAEHGVPVAGHVPRQIDLAEALRGGQRSIEHLTDYGEWIESDQSPVRSGWHWSKLYLAMPVDTAKFRDAASRIAASGVWTVPTMVQANRALAPDDTLAAWVRMPGMSHVPEEGRAMWLARVRRTTARMNAADWAVVSRGAQNRYGLVQALHTAGAGLLAGTDTPNPFVLPGSSLLEELENFARAGVPPAEIIWIATRQAAHFLGALEEWGTIEQGKRADLVLLEADPLADIRNVRRRAGVMVRGRWLPEPELQRMTSELRLR